ncbi:hypothetical protein WJX79_002316 [Trebouxia sp. C0005]
MSPLSWANLTSNKFKTTALINLAGIMERMDEQILPALYSFIGHSFQATPSQLGTLTLCRAMVQALSSPIGGLSGHYYNRVHVTSIGCVMWGVCTAGFSICRSLNEGYMFWAINGIGLSLVIPTGQSLIADYYQASNRGKAFGALYLTGSLGGMFGSLYATNLGSTTVFGWEGWRFVFLSVAAVSVLIGVLNWLQAYDPNYTQDGSTKLSGAAALGLRDIWREMKVVMSIPTFLLIIVQGIMGTIPWNALVFLTLYMQLMGMSDFDASMLMSLFLGATAVGGLLGGWVGDLAASKYPHHGRIAVTQFSVFTGIPMSWLIIKGLPENGQPGTVALYGWALVTMGVLKTWAAPACNNPVFAEIVPPHLRNMIYAFDRCFEGAIAACAAPLVGMLAEKMFGFTGTAARSGDATVDAAKARALGNALVTFLIVPWTFALIIYTGLHFTYPKDKKAAMRAAEVLAESHLQRSSSDSSDRASLREHPADVELQGLKPPPAAAVTTPTEPALQGLLFSGVEAQSQAQHAQQGPQEPPRRLISVSTEC